MSRITTTNVLLFCLCLIAVMICGSAAKAQTIFCPPSVTQSGLTVPGIALSNGTCTNPTRFPVKERAGNPKLKPGQVVEAGAFSGAALAGQAIGNLSQSMSIMQTATVTRQIGERRETESRICPPGQTLVEGICRVAPTPVVAAPPSAATPAVVAPGPETRPVRRAGARAAPQRAAVSAAPARQALRAEPRRVREVRSPVMPVASPAPAPNYIIPAHWGVWAQGFGDYEERSGRSTSQLQCCDNVNPVGLNLSASSNTTTAGFVGGVDWTARNLMGSGDGLILGIMTGYIDSSVRVSTSSVSTVQPNGDNGVANSSSTLRAHLSGPSIGVYASYFNGPWNNDLLIKNDFLDLNESFSGTLAFQTCCSAGSGRRPGGEVSPFPTFTTPVSGNGSASVNEFTVSDNIGYRIPMMSQLWVEPTVGIQYTLSTYSGNSAALGLRDGDLVRLQGGARVGKETLLGNFPVVATVTGLVYDDVLVSGDFIQGGVFGTSGDILSDEGKVRGEGIFDVRFDLGSGRSVFLQGDVRGGEDLFGGGGKGGFRVEW